MAPHLNCLDETVLMRGSQHMVLMRGKKNYSSIIIKYSSYLELCNIAIQITKLLQSSNTFTLPPPPEFLSKPEIYICPHSNQAKLSSSLTLQHLQCHFHCHCTLACNGTLVSIDTGVKVDGTCHRSPQISHSRP